MIDDKSHEEEILQEEKNISNEIHEETQKTPARKARTEENTYQSLRRLGVRERKLIRDLYDLRCLTTDQIHKHYYRTPQGKPIRKSTVYDKLASLRKKGLIDNEKLPLGYVGGFTNVYYLTDIGIEYSYYIRGEVLDIATYTEEGIEIEKNYRSARENMLKLNAIPHQLYLNDIYFAITESAKNDIDADIMFTSWPECTLKDEEGNIIISPDASFQIENNIYYIEADMGTMVRKQISKKFKRYDKYFTQVMDPNEIYNYGILFVTQMGEARAQNMFNLAITTFSIAKYGFDCYFVTTENLHELAQHLLYYDVDNEVGLAERISGWSREDPPKEEYSLTEDITASAYVKANDTRIEIEDMRYLNAKNFIRAAEAVKRSDELGITVLLMTKNEEQAKEWADMFNYHVNALYYIAGTDKIVNIYPDGTMKRNVKVMLK